MKTAGDSRLVCSPAGGLETIIGDENMLILAARPGDESVACGGLIARCCRRGRPPFVVVLTDGSRLSASPERPTQDELARLHERETRAAVKYLGLPAQRLLMAGLFDGTVPDHGPGFDAVARGITLIMWARDCNIICAPSVHETLADQSAANRIAAEVARRSGVGLLCYQTPGHQDRNRPITAKPQDESRVGVCLNIAPELAAKRAAVAAHSTRFSTVPDIPPLEIVVLLEQIRRL